MNVVQFGNRLTKSPNLLASRLNGQYSRLRAMQKSGAFRAPIPLEIIGHQLRCVCRLPPFDRMQLTDSRFCVMIRANMNQLASTNSLHQERRDVQLFVIALLPELVFSKTCFRALFTADSSPITLLSFLLQRLGWVEILYFSDKMKKGLPIEFNS